MSDGRGDWLVWDQGNVAGACALSGMTGFPDDWQLIDGLPIGQLPSRARFAMDPDLPDDIMLTDALFNSDMLIVASERLCEVVEAARPASVEFLPIPIYNHKKRKIAEPYALIHPLEHLDLLDAAGSGGEPDPINKSALARVKSLSFDASRIPGDRLLFRFKTFPDIVLVRRSLAERIDAAQATGIRWRDAAVYPRS